MKSISLRRLLTGLCMIALIVAVFAVSAYACTTIYVGGNLAADGAPIVARSEDYINSASKLMYISPSGQYKAGEKYVGCEEYGGFEWTWTHDSYRFDAYTADVFFKPDDETGRKTYVTDDDGRIIFDGVCPECGLPGHPSYTEHGTNEKGVTVSSTETISPTRQIRSVDPFKTEKVDGKVGIEETDIPTVILSEAATAREGIELLLRIYDECGCANGAGLFIADQKEIWYVENTTGTQYIALKLNNDLLFLEPNMPVIGLIDLDDENVIASERIIEVAKEAGTFVGDEAENQIDFRASYSNPASVNARMVNGLNFLNEAYSYDSAAIAADTTTFTISNVKDGNIVPVYTNIEADRKLTPDDVINYYKLASIGNTGNTDTCFFQIYPDRPLELGTVQWTSMNHGSYNVFIPCYPMLLDGLYVGYQTSVGEATKRLTEKPEGLYYASQGRTGLSYTAFPKDWEINFYWTFDALSNLILSRGVDRTPVSDEELAYVLDTFADLQATIYNTFSAEAAEIASLDDPAGEAARFCATDNYAALSMRTHNTCLSLVDYLTTGFLDVRESAYFGEPVKWAVTKEITNGVRDKVFSPYTPCTRAQAVTFLWRAMGCEKVEGFNAFTDVPADAYYADAVAWAVAKGITTGTSAEHFSPDATCTRAQIVTFLWRLAGKPEAEDPASFTDVPADAYYAGAVAWALENGITTGTSEERFSPDFECTRAQIVTFLYRNLFEPEPEEEEPEPEVPVE